MSHAEIATAAWHCPSHANLGHEAAPGCMSTPGTTPGCMVPAVWLLMAPGWPWHHPPTPLREQNERELLMGFFVLKYVIIEALPTSLIGLAVC